MPICIPEHPHFNSSEGERKVWEALREQLPAGAYLLHGVKVVDDDGEHEVDTIVAWPGVGIVFLEIKGGYIEHRHDGTWTTTNRWNETKSIDPAGQAAQGMHAVRRYLMDNDFFAHNVRSLYMVVFPDTDLPIGVSAVNLPRNRIVDKSELASIRDLISQQAHQQGLQAFATSDNCKILADALADRRDPASLWIEESMTRLERIKQLTAGQQRVLDTAKRMKSFMVLGPAGSGKTFLAVEQARRLAEQGKDVAILCYSQGLAQHLQRQADKLPAGQKPRHVGTFHGLGSALWKIQIPDPLPDDWWTHGYPAALIERLRKDRDLMRFDAIVVDEGQDFEDSWWEVLNLGYSVNSDVSHLVVFGDDDQALADRKGLEDLALPVLTLTENLRSTAVIGETAGLLASEKPDTSGIDGPPIDYLECSPEDAHDIAEEMAWNMVEDGWQPGQIAVVTTNHRHQKHLDLLAKLGSTRDYYQSLENDDIFYAHVFGFKGLERAVVVVAVDGFKDEARAKRALYAALSRARDKLIVCGDLDMIRKVGGREIADKLAAHKL